MARYQENPHRKKMWFGTQHHSQWVRIPLRGAEMSPQGWEAEGTYLSGGGFVRHSQDSHRQYIFEYAGSSSREDAETMQAFRDGVYSKSRSDLIYFIDPLIYDRNILPKRWAQPGILEDGESPLGSVSPAETPKDYLTAGLPLMGKRVASRTLANFNALRGPDSRSVWIPVPEGESLSIVSWTGSEVSDGGLYAKAQNLDGSWRIADKTGTFPRKYSGVRGVLLGTVGTFEYYGARAVIGNSLGGVSEYSWTGTPNASSSVRVTEDGTVTNRFPNPDMTGTGEVVVWENLAGVDQLVNLALGSTVLAGNNYRGLIVPVSEGDKVYIARESVSSNRFRYVFTQEEPAGGVEYFGGTGNSSLSDSSLSFPIIDVPADASYLFLYLSNAGEGVDDLIVSKVPAPIPWFSDTFSPDPDLTSQPRPGGGSQLVGTPVTSMGATNGVVVVSEEGGARLINTTGRPSTAWATTPVNGAYSVAYVGGQRVEQVIPGVIEGPEGIGESVRIDKLTILGEQLFSNPDMSQGAGEVVVWENLAPRMGTERYSPTRGTLEEVGSGEVRLTATEVSTSTAQMRISTRTNIPIQEGQAFTISLEARSEDFASVYVRSIQYDSESNIIADSRFEETYQIGGDWTRVELDIVGLPTAKDFYIYVGNPQGPYEIGDWFEFRNIQVSVSGTPQYFDETFSPDPDLTSQPRPGGGSQLVGTRVREFSSGFGAFIHSKQWSKRGGVSGRLINNGVDRASWSANLPGQGGAKTVKAWVRQEKPLSPSNSIWFGRMFFTGPLGASAGSDRSDPWPNEAGETLVTLVRENSEESILYLGGYFSDIGESIWFDSLVVLGEPVTYDGPPFSGSTPNQYPDWLVGSGNSGCRFVGNPTWVANSGVNGGQIGYATTLKEVGDWQQ